MSSPYRPLFVEVEIPARQSRGFRVLDTSSMTFMYKSLYPAHQERAAAMSGPPPR